MSKLLPLLQEEMKSCKELMKELNWTWRMVFEEANRLYRHGEVCVQWAYRHNGKIFYVWKHKHVPILWDMRRDSRTYGLPK